MMMESRIMSLIDGTDPSLEILRNMSQTERIGPNYLFIVLFLL
jgi:hypothetical protein